MDSMRKVFFLFLNCWMSVDATGIFYTTFGNVESQLSDPEPVWVLNLPNITFFHSFAPTTTPSFLMSYSNVLSDGSFTSCSYQIPPSSGSCISSNTTFCPWCEYDAAQNNISAHFIVNQLNSAKNQSKIVYSIPLSTIQNQELLRLTLKECDNTTLSNEVTASEKCDYQCSAELHCGGNSENADCGVNAVWSNEPACPSETTTVEPTTRITSSATEKSSTVSPSNNSTYPETTVSTTSSASNLDTSSATAVNGTDGNGDPGSGLSGGEIAGIVIGVLVGVALIVGLGYFIYSKKSENHSAEKYTAGSKD